MITYFTVGQILEKEQNVDIHNVVIDFQAAYDTVWRKEIQSEMQKVGFPES